jgi:hypothetical protein
MPDSGELSAFAPEPFVLTRILHQPELIPLSRCATGFSFQNAIETRNPQSVPQAARASVDTLLMTIKAASIQSAHLRHCHDISEIHLTKTTRDFDKLDSHVQSSETRSSGGRDDDRE